MECSSVQGSERRKGGRGSGCRADWGRDREVGLIQTDREKEVGIPGPDRVRSSGNEVGGGTEVIQGVYQGLPRKIRASTGVGRTPKYFFSC